MQYRRANIAGATYFFTVNLADRKSKLLTEKIDILRNAVRKIRRSYPFDILAMVVLPDHLHAIWRLPEGDANFPLRWSLIKAAFSREIPKGELIRRSRVLKRERGIWQRRYWEHQIRDDDDLEKQLTFILIRSNMATLSRRWIGHTHLFIEKLSEGISMKIGDFFVVMQKLRNWHNPDCAFLIQHGWANVGLVKL
jgi:putative transposase